METQLSIGKKISLAKAALYNALSGIFSSCEIIPATQLMENCFGREFCGIFIL